MMMRVALRNLLKLALSLGCAVALALAWVVVRSPDPNYAAHEVVFNARFHRYDALIQDSARRQGIDPMLVKAVIWRESRFQPGKLGQDGERGLMQITEGAASEWVKSEKAPDFVPSDLLDPKVNIEVGSWLLARALRRYQGKDDPVPFALAEYNAGRSRVVRWSADAKDKEANPADGGATSQELQAKIDIPSTKRYVETVQERIQFYRQRGRL